MIIAVGRLVYVRSMLNGHDTLCVILAPARPEFLGEEGGSYYYEVYSFVNKVKFLAFDYEMTLVGDEDLVPYFVME